MRRVVKQVVAIDVAKDELVVCLGRMHDDWTPELFAGKAFANNREGMTAMLAWATKLSNQAVPVCFVMEATGVYHESLALFLNDQNCEVSIVLPSKISNYMRTLQTKTITDKTASQAIAMFALERNLDRWKRPKDIYRKLRQLTRERDQIVQERTEVKNHLHAEEAEAHPGKSTLTRIKARIAMLDQQEKEIKQEIAALIASEQEVKKTVSLITSVPGVGVLTAAIIVAETNGFELIRNRRQLASYAGFDVKEKQSGTSVKGKPRISKKGNKYLRKAMHLPALAAIRHDERYRTLFATMVSKHGIKLKAAVAVQRRLLEMTYTIFKTEKKYNKDHHLKAAVVEME